jgi:hypothetical protein
MNMVRSLPLGKSYCQILEKVKDILSKEEIIK